jgi:spermidine synthase
MKDQDLHDVEYLAATERSIGMLHLSRHWRPEERTWVYEVYIDGALLMSSISPLSERELATRAIAAHEGEGPLRILIGGLGLGYTAQAALESPRASLVRVVDRMDFVIGWMKDGLLPLSKLLTEDARVELVQSDVYGDLLGEASETWDLILMDVDHAPDMPLDPASLPFYTPEGQRQVAEHLAPGGILAVWSAFDNDDFAAVLADGYEESWREEIAWSVPHDDGNDQHLVNTLFFGRKA